MCYSLRRWSRNRIEYTARPTHVPTSVLSEHYDAWTQCVTPPTSGGNLTEFSGITNRCMHDLGATRGCSNTRLPSGGCPSSGGIRRPPPNLDECGSQGCMRLKSTASSGSTSRPPALFTSSYHPHDFSGSSPSRRRQAAWAQELISCCHDDGFLVYPSRKEKSG